MKKYSPEDLFDAIISVQEISCDKCEKNDDISHSDDIEACEYFFKQGWRNTGSYVYCPKCSKKFLNKSKSKIIISKDKIGKTEITKGNKVIGKQG